MMTHSYPLLPLTIPSTLSTQLPLLSLSPVVPGLAPQADADKVLAVYGDGMIRRYG